MKTKYWLIIIIIVAILSSIISLNLQKPEIEIRTETKVVYDTITYTITTPPTIISGPVYYVDVPVLTPVDSAEILKNYFAKHSYIRTWKDSSLTVTLKDTVSQNKFLFSQLDYKISRPTTYITNTQVINPNGWYLGGSLTSKKEIYLDLDYLRGRMIYNLGIDPFDKQIKIGLKYKICKIK